LIVFEATSGIGRICFIREKTVDGSRLKRLKEFGKPDTIFGRVFNWSSFDIIAR
jgi:hypothetical protein